MITIEIPEAHGRGIEERKAELEMLRMHFSIMVREDKRHVDAVIRSAAHEPDEYAQYDLVKKDGHYYLHLTPKPQPSQQQSINGAPQPVVDAPVIQAG